MLQYPPRIKKWHNICNYYIKYNKFVGVSKLLIENLEKRNYGLVEKY